MLFTFIQITSAYYIPSNNILLQYVMVERDTCSPCLPNFYENCGTKYNNYDESFINLNNFKCVNLFL